MITRNKAPGLCKTRRNSPIEMNVSNCKDNATHLSRLDDGQRSASYLLSHLFDDLLHGDGAPASASGLTRWYNFNRIWDREAQMTAFINFMLWLFVQRLYLFPLQIIARAFICCFITKLGRIPGQKYKRSYFRNTFYKSLVYESRLSMNHDPPEFTICPHLLWGCNRIHHEVLFTFYGLALH